MQATLKRWKIYHDNRCLSRPFDDQTQERIRLETEAIVRIMDYFYEGQWRWVSSEVAMFEALPMSSRLLNYAHQFVSVGAMEISRGKYLESLGFEPFDALHLACAESGNAELLLTTDDRMLKKAKKHQCGTSPPCRKSTHMVAGGVSPLKKTIMRKPSQTLTKQVTYKSS